MNLQNLGVQELNAKEQISIDGGCDIPYVAFMDEGDGGAVDKFNQVGHNIIALWWNTGAFFLNL